MRHALAVFLLIAGVAPLQAGSTALPVGPEFQVNSYTTGGQLVPAVARDAVGNFVVVWQSFGSSGGDTALDSVQGQRYSAAGVPQGASFQANTYATGSQLDPVIASDADGDFVVIWRSDGSGGGDTLNTSVQGQRYSMAGAPQGAEFQVNSYTTSFQVAPAIASDADGDWIVVWQSNGSSGGDTLNTSVQGQRYSAAGTPQGAQFQVNSYTTSDQLSPEIASDADGDFVVVWQSNGSSGGDTLNTSVQGQRYSAAGVPQGAQFQVNSYTTSHQRYPAVASDADGDFVVVWRSEGSAGGDTSYSSIQGQRYSAAGATQGAQFQVNSYTTSSQASPAIASDVDGDFVVAWQSGGSSGGDTSGLSVHGQRYSAAGVPQGAQFQVNSYTAGDQRSPAIATDADGDFVVVWQSYGSSGGDISNLSVQGQRFRVTGDLSGRAFLDQDSDGVQDPGEPGIAGIAVELYDDTSTLRRSVVTGITGDYDLKPKEGSWTVKFVPPSGIFAFTAQDAGGDDTLDSDVDPTTGETDPFPISVNVLDETIDAGFLPLIFADGFASGGTTAWSAAVP